MTGPRHRGFDPAPAGSGDIRRKATSRLAIIPVLVVVCTMPGSLAHAGINVWTVSYASGAGPLVLDPRLPANTIYSSTNRGLIKSQDTGGSWTPLPGYGFPGTPPYVYVSALAVDPSRTTTLYAAIAGSVFTGGTLYKSLDGGNTWTQLNLISVNSIVIDPLRPATLYAGRFGGVFKSVDSGLTWTAMNSGLSDTFIEALAIDPFNTSTLYAGTHSSGVFKTVNAGTSWMSVNTGLPLVAVSTVVIDQANPNTIYAGTAVGLFKSVNGGASWGVRGAGLLTTNPEISITALAIDPLRRMTLYAAVAAGGVFRSIDGGLNWIPLNAGLPANANFYFLAVTPTSPSAVFCAAPELGIYTIQIVPGVEPCVSTANNLCLGGGRFKVQVGWRAPSQGTSGVGNPFPLTGDTGYFWFFTSNNVEVVVKIVDGRVVNGRFWVFYGALSNVEYTITVTDTVTGAVKNYFNPSGTLASVADTAAF